MIVPIFLGISIISFFFLILCGISASILDSNEDGFIGAVFFCIAIMIVSLATGAVLESSHHSQSFNKACKKINGTPIQDECYKNPLKKITVVYK